MNELLATGLVGKDVRPTVEFLARAARELQESITGELDRVESPVKQGKRYEAGLDVPQLKGVRPGGNEPLATVERLLDAPGAADAIQSNLEGNDR